MTGLFVKMRRYPREGGDSVNTVHGERVEPFDKMLLNSLAPRGRGIKGEGANQFQELTGAMQQIGFPYNPFG